MNKKYKVKESGCTFGTAFDYLLFNSDNKLKSYGMRVSVWDKDSVVRIIPAMEPFLLLESDKHKMVFDLSYLEAFSRNWEIVEFLEEEKEKPIIEKVEKINKTNSPICQSCMGLFGSLNNAAKCHPELCPYTDDYAKMNNCPFDRKKRRISLEDRNKADKDWLNKKMKDFFNEDKIKDNFIEKLRKSVADVVGVSVEEMIESPVDFAIIIPKEESKNITNCTKECEGNCQYCNKNVNTVKQTSTSNEKDFAMSLMETVATASGIPKEILTVPHSDFAKILTDLFNKYNEDLKNPFANIIKCKNCTRDKCVHGNITPILDNKLKSCSDKSDDNVKKECEGNCSHCSKNKSLDNSLPKQEYVCSCKGSCPKSSYVRCTNCEHYKKISHPEEEMTNLKMTNCIAYKTGLCTGFNCSKCEHPLF